MPLMFAAFALALPSLPDGGRLQPVEQCFRMTRGGKAMGTTYQRVKMSVADGQPIWDVVVHQRLDDKSFDMRDHFVLRRDDLLPVAFDSRLFGTPHIALRYAGGRVTGTRTEKGETKPIDIALPGPVWEGNLWGVLFGTLPLAAGARHTLPFYQYDQGIGSFELEVKGSETVATPQGPVEAWTVEAGIKPQQRVIYLISKSDGAELGIRMGDFLQQFGGDCSGMKQD